VEEQKLIASDGAAEDQFGNSVSISGDVALVGAPYDDDNGNASGSAYVFRGNCSSWVEEQKLLASDGAAFDWFGLSVSISGDVALVGAFADDDNGRLSGSAYVYELTSVDPSCQPSEGTVGTEITISAQICGEKKPKVLIGETKCKVLTFTTTSVSCLLKKVKKTMGPGTYDVTIIRKGKGVEPIVLPNAFEIMGPTIATITPASGPPKAEVTITGSFFGTKKVKAFMADGLGGKSKKGKVVSLTMDSNTGDSQLVILVPKKLAPGPNYDVTVTNKLGEDTLEDSFEIE
jgi:hypothetical protein